MSTKIWEAYALRPGQDLWTTAMDIRHRAVEEVRKTLRKIYDAMIAKPIDFFNPDEMPERPLDGRFSASRHVRKLFCAQVGSAERSLYDLDVSVVFRRASRKRWLLIPYSGTGFLSDTLAFMRKHKALADYHYQNQSDRPPKIDPRAWAARRDTWGPLLGYERWQEMFVLPVMNPTAWTHVCPSITDAVKAAKAKPAPLATSESQS